MPMTTRLCLPALLLSTAALAAATFYVDGSKGRADADGSSPEAALPTIQAAAAKVQAGDTVIVAPGVYCESVQLQAAGEAERPIVFQADQVQEGRVIVSGAVPALRHKATPWTLEDADLGLYAVPLEHKPARVLYDGVDLLPYSDLASLRAFRFQPNGYPGTRHGFAWVEGKLYVRLHAGGRYGSPDPNAHLMAVAPAGGRGRQGLDIANPADYNFGVLAPGPAHVVLAGFTFETPGVAGVFVAGSDVTVRDCWFRGCRAGVAGVRKGLATVTTQRVTIEYCDYHQYPAFDDMLEVIREHSDDPWRGERKELSQQIFWWQRKGAEKDGSIGYNTTYETGIAAHIGKDWTIRGNYVHDAFEGLSTWGADRSVNLRIYGNRFARLVDNAVETENHAVKMHVYGNEVVDVFEPFSWQPLNGTPWPGPVSIYRNLVYSTPASLDVWTKAGWLPGIWKLGASERQWARPELGLKPDEPVRAGGEGFLAFNNTVYAPDHCAFVFTQSRKRNFEGFEFFNNLCVLKEFCNGGSADRGLEGAANAVAFLAPQPELPKDFAANGGRLVADAAALGLANPAEGRFEPQPGSPALGLRRPDSPPQALPDAGSIAAGQTWNLGPVGPRATAR